MFDIILIAVFLIAIFLGIRMKGLGVAYAAGLGLFIITMILGVAPGELPFSVVIIIISVIGAIGILELSGGLDYIVSLAEKLLRSKPQYINFLAPMVTFFLTVLAGTGHTAYSVMPVIVEVAKRQGIRPVRPLTSAAVASQIGITASPISAATVALVGVLAFKGITLGSIMLIMLPSSIIGIIVVAIFQSCLPQALATDKTYQALLASGTLTDVKMKEVKIKKRAPLAVVIFLLAIIGIVIYGLFPNLKPIYSTGKNIDMALLIVIIMLIAGYIMVLVTKSEVSHIPKQATFQVGMSAALCVIGVAWLGNTVVEYYSADIKLLAGDFLQQYSWAFAIILFLVSALLYSQAAATIAIMPLGLSLGLSPLVCIASFVAVNGLFVLPTYPTVLAAVSMDYTGTTKMGKYIFNHSFFIPGVLMIVISIICAYAIGSVVL